MTGSRLSARMRAGISIGAAAIALSASAAGAQTVANDTSDSTTEEIVVTAERRATNLQDTPLSIIAVTQEKIEAKGIQDLQDLSHFTPNLSISPTRGNGTGAVNFVIRGISGGGGATGERGVGLYVDGIYMPRTSGSILRVLDVDRIEVLRGPQGTLFGRNSTGGAIRIFSKQPELGSFSGSVEATYGNQDHKDLLGMINVPLGQNFALRAQAAYLDKDGYVQRGTEKLGSEKDYVGRIQLKGEITPSLTAVAGFVYNRSKQNGSPFVIQEFDLRPGIDGVIQGNYGGWINDAFKLAGQAPIAAYNDARFVRGNYKAPDVCFLDDFNPDYDAACNQVNNDTFYQGDLRVDWKLGEDFSLHSISGYSKLKHFAISDQEGIGFEARYDIIHSKTFYQELQLNASLLNAIDVVGGATYFHEDSSSPKNYVLNRRGTAVYNNTAYTPTSGSPPNADGGLYTRSITDTFQTSRSWGLFGSATWHIVKGLNLTGGVRQAWDHKDYRQNRYQPTNPDSVSGPDFRVVPGTTMSSASKSQPFHALDYRVTLDYHLTDDIMAYGTISKAYKAGAFSATLGSYNTASPTTILQTGTNQDFVVATIPNEKVINYEGGVRASFFDRHLKINPTYFNMTWSNRQAAIRVNCGTAGTPLADLVPGSAACPVGFLPLLQDQGTAKIHGLELDTQVIVGGGLSFDGNLGITNYKLKNVPVAAAGSFPITHLFPDIPKTSYTIGANYDANVGIGRAKFNVSYAYVGKQWVYPDDNPDSTYRLPAYGLVNARIQFTPNAIPLTITAYANNLLDKTYATYANRFGGGFWDQGPATGLGAPTRNMLSVVRGRPREFGVTAKYAF